MRTPLPLLVGAAAGLVLTAGAMGAGIAGHTGTALRQVQQVGLDLIVGSPSYVATPVGPVATWTAGPADRPMIVLIHGFGDAAAGWTPVAADLATEYRVVLLDLPGHRRSAPYGNALSMADVQAGVDAVLLDLEPPYTLVGNSLGGWVSAHHALAHPDRVERLMLVNTAGLPNDVDKATLLPTTRDGVREKNRIVMGAHTPDVAGPLLDAFIALNQDPRLQSLWEDLDTRPRYLTDDLPDLDVPVALIWGTPDAYFPVEGYLDRLQRLVPDAPLTRLDGCGHAPQYSCPARLAEAVRGLDGG